MLRIFDTVSKSVLCLGLALGMLVPLNGAYANAFRVIYSFKGTSKHSNDGAHPYSSLIADAAGNLYGTTGGGGADYGTVFELATNGTETVLHSFDGSDGSGPSAGLIADAAGNLYGTTGHGGAHNLGTVFKLAPDGSETVLHSFAGGTDGASPAASLIADTAGNLYGTTADGGGTDCKKAGCGTVFKLAPDGTETILHSFVGDGSDGISPFANLIADATGNLFGTTYYGGGKGCQISHGCGTVFKVAPDGTETVLHAFAGGTDGVAPAGGLILDSAGNLYGTTLNGGKSDPTGGCGIIFKLAPDGTETVLYNFNNGSSCAPYAGLIADAKGNLYGTTLGPGTGGGTVFKLSTDGIESVLHAFSSGYRVPGLPYGSLILIDGNLYGTTFYGRYNCQGIGCGAVFKVKE